MTTIRCNELLNHLTISNNVGVATLKFQQIVVTQDNLLCTFNVVNRKINKISVSLQATEEDGTVTICSNKEHEIVKSDISKPLLLQKNDKGYTISYKNRVIVICTPNTFMFLDWKIVTPAHNYFVLKHKSLEGYKIYYSLAVTTPNFSKHDQYGISHFDSILGIYEICIRHMLHPDTISDYLIMSFKKSQHRNLYQITPQKIDIIYNYSDENLRLNYTFDNTQLHLTNVQACIRDNSFFDVSYNEPLTVDPIPCSMAQWIHILRDLDVRDIYPAHISIVNKAYTTLADKGIHLDKSFTTPRVGYINF